MSSNKDFLPSCSPISSTCIIEIEAILVLFIFMMNCYKSSFQECITITVLKIERARNQPPYCLLQLQEKKVHSASLGRVVLGLPSSSPRVCTDGRTDGWTYADVRTKIFRINRLPNLLTHGAPRVPLIVQDPLRNNAHMGCNFCLSFTTIVVLDETNKGSDFKYN